MARRGGKHGGRSRVGLVHCVREREIKGLSLLSPFKDLVQDPLLMGDATHILGRSFYSGNSVNHTLGVCNLSVSIADQVDNRN